MDKSMVKRRLIISILALFIEITVIPCVNQNLSYNSRAESFDNLVNIAGIEYNNNDIQTTNKLINKTIKKLNYTEQPPPPPLEWDGIYKNYTLVSQETDINYDRMSQNRSTNLSMYAMKYKLKDRYFDSYYKTNTAFNIATSPCFFWFNFPKATNISFMRYYFYDLEGMDFAPAIYEIYNGSTYVATYNITPQVNGQWVRINFNHDIVRTMNFTLKILHTRGSIDHPGVYTKVVINELELFENKKPTEYIQNAVPLYEGISKFWNGLDWAFSLRIDDCTCLTMIPSWWANITPITVMCFNPSYPIDESLVDLKHMEIGSHGNRLDHRPNYEKSYSWWYLKANAAKGSVENFTNKTSIWSDKCISFAIPYSVMDPPGGRALLDAGFKYAGSTLGPGWKLRLLGRQNISIFNVSEPKSQVPIDWMFTYPAGYAKIPWDYNNTMRLKENHSYANLYGHPFDILDQNFTSFIENDTTGWHCTLGEISSYWWYKDRMNITYNMSSNYTEKIFDINILENHPNIWEVPITFTFNLTNVKWNESIVVKWRNNNTVYTNQLKNITGFFPGVGQHQNQTMQEGYRWDRVNHILYISIRPGERDRPKSIHLFFIPNHPPNIPEKPSGAPVGKINNSYAYTTRTIDFDNDHLFYWFDWGDGTNSGWVGPYASGTNVTEYHLWTKTGNYLVKAKAKDKENESEWSNPLNVEIIGPKLEIKAISGGIGVSTRIKNNGTDTATNVSLTIKISGGLFDRINKITSSTIVILEPQNETASETGIFFGLGKIRIHVTATYNEEETIERNATGFIFGPIVFKVKLK